MVLRMMKTMVHVRLFYSRWQTLFFSNRGHLSRGPRSCSGKLGPWQTVDGPSCTRYTPPFLAVTVGMDRGLSLGLPEKDTSCRRRHRRFSEQIDARCRFLEFDGINVRWLGERPRLGHSGSESTPNG